MCAYFALLSCTVDDGDPDCENIDLQDMVNLDGSKTPGVNSEIESECLIQDNFFDDRESNDSDYQRDPFDEVSEHHHKYMVRMNFSCFTCQCLSLSTNPSVDKRSDFLLGSYLR